MKDPPHPDMTTSSATQKQQAATHGIDDTRFHNKLKMNHKTVSSQLMSELQCSGTQKQKDCNEHTPSHLGIAQRDDGSTEHLQLQFSHVQAAHPQVELFVK